MFDTIQPIFDRRLIKNVKTRVNLEIFIKNTGQTFFLYLFWLCFLFILIKKESK